eukprot:snap_masked-scaffold_21-processed-gene-0.24-mRNA-1 protein AED:1.00 eAED:1.00 QI:0/0/0/0/1/1/2/0/169
MNKYILSFNMLFINRVKTKFESGKWISQEYYSSLREQDCEYEYFSFTECFLPFETAVNEAIASFSPEVQEEFEELTEIVGLSPEEFAERREEIFGKEGLCTPDVLELFPTAVICQLRNCFNCDNNTLIQEIIDFKEVGELFIGCENELSICGLNSAGNSYIQSLSFIIG